MNTLAKVPDQKLAELVIRSVYEGDDTRPGGTKVLSIGEVVLGTPAGGWSTTAVIDGPEGEDALSVEYTPEGGYRDWVQGAAGGGDRSAETEQATDSADTFQPPESAANNARRVLAWRDKYGDEVQGMTAVGWARARQLASGNPISLETVKRMSSFNRHRGNYEKARARQKEEGKNPWEYAAITAWLGWGGDSGVSWAISVSARNDDIPTVDTLPNTFTLDSLPQPLRSLAAELAARGPVVYPLDGLAEGMASELGNRAVVELDAEPTDEQLVLLAVRAIYEQSNWKVTGISNLVIGEPEGGLTVDVEMRNPDTRAAVTVRGTYLDGVFEDTLLSETKGDIALEDEGFEDDGTRTDAAKAKEKGRKRTGPPKCNKGRPCGNSCVRMLKANGDPTSCKNEVEGVVKESLEKVSRKGKGKPNPKPKTEPKAKAEPPPVQRMQVGGRANDPNKAFFDKWSKSWGDSPDLIVRAIERNPYPPEKQRKSGPTASFSLNEGIHMDTFSPGQGRANAVWRHEYGHYIDAQLTVGRSGSPVQIGYRSSDNDSIEAMRQDATSLISRQMTATRKMRADLENIITKGRNPKGGYSQAKLIKAGLDKTTAEDIIFMQAAGNTVSPADIARRYGGSELRRITEARLALTSNTAFNKEINANPFAKGLYEESRKSFGDKGKALLIAQYDDPATVIDFAENVTRKKYAGERSGMIFDLAGSITKNKIGRGHSNDYYYNESQQSVEAFANVFSLLGSGDIIDARVARNIAPSYTRFVENVLDKEVRDGQ